jgi:hypothetical protein
MLTSPSPDFRKGILQSTERGKPRLPAGSVDLDEVTPFTRYLKEEGELRRVA